MKFFKIKTIKNLLFNGDWGLGIGDWGLGIGGLGIGPNPQSPIPNPQSTITLNNILMGIQKLE